MNKNRNITSVQALCLLFVSSLLALGAGGWALHNAFLQDNLNANGYSITNADSVNATNFYQNGTPLVAAVISIDSNGVPIAFSGSINVGTNANINAGALAFLASGGTRMGTISQVNVISAALSLAEVQYLLALPGPPTVNGVPTSASIGTTNSFNANQTTALLYAGTVTGTALSCNIGSSVSLTAALPSAILSAGTINGTISAVSGCDITDGTNWASSSSITVSGTAGVDGNGGGAAGVEGSVTEGSHFTVTTVQGGTGGQDDNSSGPGGGNGGAANAYLYPAGTNWTLSISGGDAVGGSAYGQDGAGGAASVYLASTQSSITLSVGMNAGTCGSENVGGNASLSVSGSSLTNINFTFSGGGGSNNTNGNPSITVDVSGTALSDASLDAMAVACQSLSPNGQVNYIFNAAGTCDPTPSSGTLADLTALLTTYGWTTVNHN